MKGKLKNKWPFLLPGIILVIALIFFPLTKSQLQYGEEINCKDIGTFAANVGEIKSGDIFEQKFISPVDKITEIALPFATYGRTNYDTIKIQVLNDKNIVLFEHMLKTETLKDNSQYILDIKNNIQDVRNQELLLRVESLNGEYGNAVTLYCEEAITSEYVSLINGQPFTHSIAIGIKGKKIIPYSQIYFCVVLGILVPLLCYSRHVYRCEKIGKGSLLGNAVRGINKYWFLLKQLVSRDFKTKYKRSVLGIFWSLLNPLLTMTVQYIVFSKLFRFDIANYPVYLLSGIVFFNYMSDATSQAMTCIINNASLINKVYVPKYIYPFSRVLSCGVNFLLSLLALYIVILVTGLPITINHVALIFGMLCVFMFTLGLSFLLSTLMVFFRDTQFLYSVFLQMWIYLTPLFYPESILPNAVMHIVECNPMYHFIRFVRIIILDGVLPEFKAWILCAVFALLPLVIGYSIFRKYQQKFILYI